MKDVEDLHSKLNPKLYIISKSRNDDLTHGAVATFMSQDPKLRAYFVDHLRCVLVVK